MEYFLSDEHIMVQDLAKQIAEEKIKPVAEEFDIKEEFPHELFKLFAESDLFAVPIPEEFGGMGIGHLGKLIVIEELSRACAGITLSYIDHIFGYTPLLLGGTTEQKKKYFSSIISGEGLFAFALAEPQSGSDAGSLQMVAKKDGDSYILSGEKSFVTNGGVADFYTIFALTNPELGKNGISAFLVPKETEGLEFGPPLKKMGVKAIPLTSMKCNNLKIPKENLIGEENNGFSLALRSITLCRPTIAAQAVGIAQNAFELSVGYATERKQFNRPIADFEGLQFMMAKMATKIEAARALVFQTGKMMDAGFDTTKEASMAKLFASDVAMEVTTDAVQIFGGYGYMKEYPVEKLFRDAKVTQLYAGTNEIQQLVIAKKIIPEYAKGDYKWSVA